MLSRMGPIGHPTSIVAVGIITSKTRQTTKKVPAGTRPPQSGQMRLFGHVFLLLVDKPFAGE
jgi:hypothetical protein